MGQGAARGQGGIAADTYTRERTLGRGLLAGTAWGALVGVISIALASQLTDRRDLASAPRGVVPAGDEISTEVVASVAPEPEAGPEPRPEPEPGPDPVPEPEPASEPEAAPTPVVVDAEVAPAEAAPETPTAPAPPAAPAGASPDPVPPAASSAGVAGREAPVAAPVPEPGVRRPAAPASAEALSPAPAVAPPPQVAAPGAAGARDTVAAVALDPVRRPVAPQAALPGVAPPPPTVPADGVRAPEAPATSVAAGVPAALDTTLRGAPAGAGPATPRPDAPPSAVQRAPVAPPSPAEPPVAPPVEPEVAIASEGDDAPGARAPTPGFQGAAGVRVNRLPTVGGAGSEPAPVAEADVPEIDPSTEPDAPQPALVRHSVPFDNPGDDPLIAVILVHGGSEGPGPDAAAGLELPLAVSFAVDAGAERAREIAAAYRAAGREVLLVPTLPPGAAPSDVEVALSVNFDTIPEAVALMDTAEGGFQSERDALAQVVAAVSATGHGLITFPRGLNTAQQLADRAGVPARTVFRVLEDGNPDAVLRTLDQAAFRARQEGVVILVGQAEPATVAALSRWVAANPNRQVAFAPVSAALTAR